MTKALSEIFGFGQPATPMTPAEKAAEREQKKKKREELKKQQAATREKRKEELDNKRAAEKKAKEERHDARVEKRGNRQVELARQNASGAKIRATAASKRQLVTGKGTTTSATKLNRARVDLANAKTTGEYIKAARRRNFHAMRKKINLQKSMMNQSTEYDMSVVEIISESCMFGLNEDYYRIDHGKVPTTFSSNHFHGHDDDSNEITGVYASHKKHAMGHVYAVPREVPWVFHHNNDGQKNLYIHKDHKDKVENHSATLSKFHKSNGFRGIDGSDEENVSKKNERPHSQTKIDSADHIRKQGIKIHYVDSNKLKQKANQTHTDKGKTFKAAGNENINEDMYFKVKIEGLPTMYVNSANREELRKDLVGLLRNPSKAVGDIKRVTPQEVKKRLRLRSQGKEEEEMNETYIKFDHPKLKFVSKGFIGRKEAERHNDHLVGKEKASHKSFVQKHKDGKFYVVDMNESSVTRSRISGEMDKASGRTQIDRKNDLAKAAKARQDSEKDLATFRKKNAKVLQSSIDEVTAGDVTAAYQRAMMHPQGSPERKEAMDYYHSVRNRHKHDPIDVGEATADVINKLKEYYTNESKAYYAGLSKSTADDRKAHFKKHGKKADDDNSAYKPAPGDATAKTKPSIHTKKAAAMGMGPKNEAGPGLWANIHKKRKEGRPMRKKGEKGAPTPEAIRSAQKESYNINENKKGLENKAEKSGMPLGVLKQVYNRGMAAWKTGHRPGTTPEQWGMARVNSFITKSSGTWGKADKDLAAKVKK
jgi:hypothetical protein